MSISVRPKLISGDSCALFTPAPASDGLKLALVSAQENYAFSNLKSSQAYGNACRYGPGGNSKATLNGPSFPLSFGG